MKIEELIANEIYYNELKTNVFSGKHVLNPPSQKQNSVTQIICFSEII